MDCRLSIDGRDAGAAFTIGSRLALTARHVLRAALDVSGGLRPGCDVELLPAGEPGRRVTGCTSDAHLDVAVLHLDSDVPRWVAVGAPSDDAPWRVTGRPRGGDPGLSGRITFAGRPVQSADGNEVSLTQLHVDQELGDYEGYSGSAVLVPEASGAPRALAVGIVIEQVRWRVQPVPGTRLRPAANVLYAVPAPDALARLGLAGTVPQRPAGAGAQGGTAFRPEDEIVLTRLLRDALDESDLLDIAACYGPRGRLPRRNFAARLPGQGLDARVRALVDDAARTSSARVLVECVAEVRPDLAGLLPRPAGA